MKLSREQLHEAKARAELLMRDRRSEYWRGPNAAKIQAEYRQVLTALEDGSDVHAASSGEGEKRELETIMYFDRKLWNATPELGERYREILIDEGGQQ